MRALRSVVLACVCSALFSAAVAQTPPAFKPYKRIEADLGKGVKDPSLDAFRKQLAGIAQKRDRAALKQIAGAEFFFENDVDGLFNEKRSSTDNLLAALRLDRDQERGWADLRAFAEEPSSGPLPGHRGIVCAPAPPHYNDPELFALTEETGSDVADWYYPRQAGVGVRAAPEAGAAVIETLGLAFVRVLGFDRRRGDTASRRTSWARVATPSGKSGFVAPNVLVSPVANRLCFSKNGSSWTIAGFVGGGE